MVRIRGSISGDAIIGCANDRCPKLRYPANELLFVCPGGKQCPGARKSSSSRFTFGEDREKKYDGLFLFRPQRFRYSVRCPESPHDAYVKVCPHCGTQQPASLGDSSTLAVIGTGTSGKTCFITSLIHQIHSRLANREFLSMALQWRDDASRNYFRELERQMFIDQTLPEKTQKNVPPKCLDITVRFPMSGWWNELRNKQAVLSIAFPDPAGEMFQSLENASFLTFLNQAPQIMLMVDPFGSQAFSERRQRAVGDGYAVHDILANPVDALDAVIEKMRGEGFKGLIPKDLAVVLTKCDEPGALDLDAPPYNFVAQGRRYSLELMRKVSDRVEQFISSELNMPLIVANAKQNFQRVGFFSASALGRPPRRMKRGEQWEVVPDGPAEPRRVEEPFLWALHRRRFL